jgi:hypothetical protein
MSRTKKQVSVIYLNGQYNDYEYGKPEDAAEKIVQHLRKIEDILVEVNKDLKLAGTFLQPGMKKVTIEDLTNIIKSNLK